MNGKNLLIGLSYIDRKYIEESEQDIPVKKAITPARNQHKAQCEIGCKITTFFAFNQIFG